MRFLWSRKPEAPRRRKRKSRKWIDHATSEANARPTLVGLKENPIIKAAILSSVGQFRLTLEDIMPQSLDGVVYTQHIIWAIEALQKNYREYLDYRRWVAIRQGIHVVNTYGMGRKGPRDHKQYDTFPATPGKAPAAPDIDEVIDGEVDRRFAQIRARAARAQPAGELLQFLRMFNDAIEKAARTQSAPQDTFAVEIDGNFVEMSRDGYEAWKRDRDKLNRLKRQASERYDSPDRE